MADWVKRWIKKDIVELIETHDWRTEEEIALGRRISQSTMIDRALMLADKERRNTSKRRGSW